MTGFSHIALVSCISLNLNMHFIGIDRLQKHMPKLKFPFPKLQNINNNHYKFVTSGVFAVL